ncbi:hypothetical protein ONE63_003426 [Megalurothrips usitatus]|uniref:hAT-like transposase RNase-H fold domain-containing protein n=1 Tax=Megalurothrips usitatus TaxID=439358 RepID=A0AAV7XAZ2_9NEOP|nr:hypothetical protein ONE63_003426 [Megalurothrips usitatus]
MFMCKGLKPYSIVEELGFKYLLYILEPRYVIPSRTTFARNIIPEMYQSLRRKLQLKLSDVKSELESVSIAIDIWTSRAQDPFIAFNLQYVSPEFNMESYTLDLEPFSGHHTAEAICKKLDEKLEDIELNDDDIEKFVVSDNGSNMLAALEQSSEDRRLDREIAEILRQRKSWEHLKCFNHTAQLAITDTKRDMNMNNVIDKTSRLVTRYKKSATAKEALERYQKDLDLAPHSMLQRVKTRWNSDHIMLARAVEQKQAIINECAASGESCLSASEWRLAEGFVQVLQPIADHTDELGSQTVPTASMVLPVICEIQAELQEFIQKAPKGTGIQFARKLLTNVENRFFYYNSKEVYKVAMVVDPRFKTLLEHESWFTTGKELLIDEADEKYLQRIQKGLVQTPQDTETVGDTPASAPEAGTKSSKWRHLVKKSVNRTSIASTSTERRNKI